MLKIEATGDLRITKARKKVLEAMALIIEAQFGEELYAVFVNHNVSDPKRIHGINFVFHKETPL